MVVQGGKPADAGGIEIRVVNNEKVILISFIIIEGGISLKGPVCGHCAGPVQFTMVIVVPSEKFFFFHFEM